MNDNFSSQSKFYDTGYETLSMGNEGFPDLKIVDYDLSITQKKILSIGGGNCADLWFLSPKNEVSAIDGSSVGMRLAETHGIRTHIGDVTTKFPYEDNYFDIVVLKDILEHVYSPLDVLQDAKRVLKKEGYIIISLPNHFYFPFRLRLLFGKNIIWKSLLHDHTKDFEEWNYMHIRFFTWTGVKKMLDVAGFVVDKPYWDFGTLAHYSDPLMYEHAFVINKKEIKTKRQIMMYRFLLPVYHLCNFVFPKKIRSWIVSLAPGFFCAGFYLRIKLKNSV